MKISLNVPYKVPIICLLIILFLLSFMLSKSIAITEETMLQPDLIITDIKISPNQPKTGDQVTFTAVVKNVGTAVYPAGIGCYFLFEGDEPSVNKTKWYSNSYNNSINVGETVQLSSQLKWKAVKGTHYLSTVLNSQEQTIESNTLNNVFVKPLTVVAPPKPADLYIRGFGISPKVPLKNKPISFIAVIENRGGLAIEKNKSIRLDLIIEEVDKHKKYNLSTYYKGGLNPDKTATVTLKRSLPGGNYSYSISVNSNKKISESSYSNNKKGPVDFFVKYNN